MILVYLSSESADKEKSGFIAAMFTTAGAGIILTHCYRQIIVSFNWFRYSVLKLILPVLTACLVIGGIFWGFALVSRFGCWKIPIPGRFNTERILLGTISQSVLDLYVVIAVLYVPWTRKITS
jgi:hypothetical protein